MLVTCRASLLIGVLFASSALGQTHSWSELKSTALQAGQDDVSWRASVLEGDKPGTKSDQIVGNSDTAENFSERKLVIEVFDAASSERLRRDEVLAPTQTIAGDPCSIANLSQLEAQDHRLALTVDYVYACGAGSGTTASYTIEIARSSTRIVKFEWISASRDATNSICVDYSAGRMSIATDRPEDESPSEPQIHAAPKGAIALTGRALLECPLPLRGESVPSCRVP
jgi:hypothetical protein